MGVGDRRSRDNTASVCTGSAGANYTVELATTFASTHTANIGRPTSALGAFKPWMHSRTVKSSPFYTRHLRGTEIHVAWVHRHWAPLTSDAEVACNRALLNYVTSLTIGIQG